MEMNDGNELVVKLMEDELDSARREVVRRRDWQIECQIKSDQALADYRAAKERAEKLEAWLAKNAK